MSRNNAGRREPNRGDDSSDSSNIGVFTLIEHLMRMGSKTVVLQSSALYYVFALFIKESWSRQLDDLHGWLLFFAKAAFCLLYGTVAVQFLERFTKR